MTDLHAGTTPADAGDEGARVHAVDGDGSSLCELVGAGGLVRVDDLRWTDIDPAHRCPSCQTLMTAYGMGHL